MRPRWRTRAGSTSKPSFTPNISAWPVSSRGPRASSSRLERSTRSAMARNDDNADLRRWVDDRLATLTPDVEWDPSVPRGLARLRSESDRPRRRWTLWIAAAATASVLLFVPTPALRAFAHSCGEFIARNLPGAAGRTARASVRPVVPDLALTDQDGRPVTLSSLRGKVVLLT